MADEPTPVDEPRDDDAGHDDDSHDRPEQNIRAELERRREAQAKAERELAELRSKILDFEDRDKSDAERAKARADRAEQELSRLMGEVTSLKKGAWVRSAAAELDFVDPDDAVTYLQNQLGNLEDPRDAKRAVKQLASSKKHLLRQKEPEQRPQIGRIFAGQGVQQQNGGQQTPMNPAQASQRAAAERELQFAQGIAGELNRFRDQWHHAGGVS